MKIIHWFSKFPMHQKLLEDLFKHRFLGLTPEFDSFGQGWGLRTGTSASALVLLAPAHALRTTTHSLSLETDSAFSEWSLDICYLKALRRS